MDFIERKRQIEEHFKSLTVEQFEKNLEKAGMNMVNVSEMENAIRHLKVRNFTGKQIDMAIQALEKQIPKIIEFDENDLNICPECNEHVKTDDKYCSYCGQRLEL